MPEKLAYALTQENKELNVQIDAMQRFKMDYDAWVTKMLDERDAIIAEKERWARVSKELCHNIHRLGVELQQARGDPPAVLVVDRADHPGRDSVVNRSRRARRRRVTWNNVLPSIEESRSARSRSPTPYERV